MDWFTSGVVFMLVWWTLLFAVLPFWTRPQSEADERTGWRGVPERPMMLRKLLVTTAVSVVVWGRDHVGDLEPVSVVPGVVVIRKAADHNVVPKITAELV